MCRPVSARGLDDACCGLNESPLASGVRIWLVAGVTDMRRGFEGLSALVQTALNESPYSGQIFVFRGRRGDKIKIL
jgi:transposase